MRAYVAAPLAAAQRAQAAAFVLRSAGIDVTSRWHAVTRTGGDEALTLDEKRSQLADNLADLSLSDVVLALPSADMGRETYVEIGRHMARDRLVVWSDERGGLALSACDKVLSCVFKTDEDAVAYVCRMHAAGIWTPNAIDEEEP